MYPEHEKMEAVLYDSQIIGEFLESSPYVLGEWYGDLLVPVSWSTEQVLANYFGIDLKKIEDEKRQMLEEIKNMR